METEIIPPPPLATPPQKKKRHGCLWALLITFIAFVVLLIAGVLVVRSLVKGAIRDYTATQPVALPPSTATPADARAVTERLQKFFENLRVGQAMEPFRLTADDLNRLIVLSGTNGLAGKVFFSIEDDRVRAQVSAPMDKIGGGQLHGRYLNGNLTLKVDFNGGELRVWASDLEANGKPLPAWIMKSIQQRNLAENALNDQDTYSTIQMLETIVVTNGAVLLMPK